MLLPLAHVTLTELGTLLSIFLAGAGAGLLVGYQLWRRSVTR